MRLEMTRTFPVPRQQVWDYMEDFHTWPEWWGGGLAEPEKGARTKKGDTVRVTDPLLGSLYTGSLILEEKVAPEMSRTLLRWPGWPDFHVEFHYTEAGSEACTLRGVTYVDENAGPAGKSVAWLMTLMPFMMKRQMRLVVDRLDRHFREGPSEREVKKPAKARPVKHKVA